MVGGSPFSSLAPFVLLLHAARALEAREAIRAPSTCRCAVNSLVITCGGAGRGHCGVQRIELQREVDKARAAWEAQAAAKQEELLEQQRQLTRAALAEADKARTPAREIAHAQGRPCPSPALAFATWTQLD